MYIIPRYPRDAHRWFAVRPNPKWQLRRRKKVVAEMLARVGPISLPVVNLVSRELAEKMLAEASVKAVKYLDLQIAAGRT